MRSLPRASVRPLAAALVAALACLAPGAKASSDFPLPLLGHESVAAVEGADALLFNPAAVGTRYPSELLLAVTDEAAGPRLYRVLVAGGTGGIGVVNERGGPRGLVTALGGGDRRLRMGASMTRLSGGSNGKRATDWSFGLLSRPAPWLSFGATAEHLGEPDFDGARLERAYTAGVGWRPLALLPRAAHSLGPRATLTADVRGLESDRAAAYSLRLGAELEVIPGLVARGAWRSRGGYQIGIGLLGTRAAYHGHSAFAPGGARRSTTHALSFHDGEDRTALAAPSERRIGEMRLGGALGDDALAGVSVFGGRATTPVGPIHRRLRRALEDPLTRGVLLDLRGVSNMAQIEELRARVLALRAAGKPVVAFLEQGGGRGDLYLASACDRIVTTEEADFAALGVRVERRYYRQALERWGVRIDRASVGAYKSAYRNFSVDSTPPADREAIERNLDVQQQLFVSAVAADRKMDRARLIELLDGRQWPPADLVRAGLVDSIGYREDARRILGRMTGLGIRPRRASLARLRPAEREWRLPRPLAVVYLSGGIETGPSGSDLLNGPYMGSETVVPQLEKAFRDREVKAVVLRIESPGGSSLASNLIHHAAQRLKRETQKPVVVSMGGVAGSGGYYIALPGDRLFADRFTRTGSIGVLYVKPSLEGWYEKHGVREDDFERGGQMGGWSQGRDWTPRRQASADSAIRVTYASFKAKVGAARGLSAEEVEKAAQGRVWMGEDARDRRLVDALGGLDEAIADARRRAGVPEGERIALSEYRRPAPALIERLIGTTLRSAWERSLGLREPAGTQLRADPDDEE